MAIDLIAKQIWDEGRAVLEVTSERSDALDDFESSLRNLNPHIVIARDGLIRINPNKLKAKLTVNDNSFDWVLDQLLSTLTNDALNIKLVTHEPT